MQERQIILIGGGSCSGKSVFAHLFKHAFILEMDHFYKGKSEMTPQPDGSYNFDAPEAVNLKECAQAAKALTQGKRVTIPKYDMKVSERIGVQTITLPQGARFIIVEGIFALYPPLLELGDLRIFVDTPTEIRVARRMIRDVEKGRSEIDTLSWSITVEKNHKKYIEPTKKYADIVIPFSYNPVRFTV